MFQSAIKLITGWVRLRGNTDDTFIGNNSDSLKVHVTNGGSGGTAQADESTFTEGTSSFTPVGGVLNETISSDPTEDQAAAVRITAKRALHTNLRNNAGTEVGTSGDPIRIDPTGSTTQPVSQASQPLPTGAATSANQTTEITSLQLIDDIVHAVNDAINKAALVAGQLDDTSTTAATENNVASLRITPQRAAHINLRNQSGTEVGTSTNPLYHSIRGNTDGTIIGNLSDRIKVDFQEMQKETYIVGSTSIAIGNNKSMLSLLNADATKIVKLREVLLYNAATSAVTGVIGDFQLFRFTGHSAGTALTPASYDTDDSLDADITARTGGTITGEAASALRRWLLSTDEWGTGTADVESGDHAVQNWGQPLYKHDSPFQKPITLRVNQGIHLKQVTNSTAGNFDVYFVFTEE